MTIAIAGSCCYPNSSDGPRAFLSYFRHRSSHLALGSAAHTAHEDGLVPWSLVFSPAYCCTSAQPAPGRAGAQDTEQRSNPADTALPIAKGTFFVMNEWPNVSASNREGKVRMMAKN
jgi:hypothetical protein